MSVTDILQIKITKMEQNNEIVRDETENQDLKATVRKYQKDIEELRKELKAFGNRNSMLLKDLKRKICPSKIG